MIGLAVYSAWCLSCSQHDDRVQFEVLMTNRPLTALVVNDEVAETNALAHEVLTSLFAESNRTSVRLGGKAFASGRVQILYGSNSAAIHYLGDATFAFGDYAFRLKQTNAIVQFLDRM